MRSSEGVKSNLQRQRMHDGRNKSRGVKIAKATLARSSWGLAPVDLIDRNRGLRHVNLPTCFLSFFPLRATHPGYFCQQFLTRFSNIRFDLYNSHQLCGFRISCQEMQDFTSSKDMSLNLKKTSSFIHISNIYISWKINQLRINKLMDEKWAFLGKSFRRNSKVFNFAISRIDEFFCSKRNVILNNFCSS